MTIDVTNTVKLLAKSTDETEGTFLLVAINKDGNWREHVIQSKKLLDMKAIRGELVHRGHPLTDDQVYWQSVKESLYGNTDKRFRLITCPGWSGYSYISADDQLLGRLREGEIKPRFNPEYQVASRADSSVKSDEFREAITPILRSSSRIMLAACTAYSGYLAPFTEVQTGGFHFYGDSSIGKTTALRIAASIQFGVEGIASWDMTEKGFEEVAAIHNHNVLILDELKLLDGDPKVAAKKATKLVYMLAEQKGKRRSTQYEASRASWKLSILSAGERSLTEHAQDGRIRHMDGERVRLTDIPADTGSRFGIYEYLPEGFNSIREYVSHVTSVVDQSRGGARRFIKAISSMLQRKGDGYLKAKIAGLVDEFLSLPEFAELEGQKERILKRFGLAYAAGVIASEKRCIGLSVQELQKGLSVCALAALEDLRSPAEVMAEKLCQELSRLTEKKTLLESEESSAEELLKEPVFILTVLGDTCYAIDTQYFNQVVDKDIRKNVKKLLFDAGILVKDAEGNPTRYVNKLAKRRYILIKEAVHRYLQKNEK